MTIRDDDNLRIKCLELAQQERAPCPDDRANTLYHQVRDDKKWPLPPREPASGWYFLLVVVPRGSGCRPCFRPRRGGPEGRGCGGGNRNG